MEGCARPWHYALIALWLLAVGILASAAARSAEEEELAAASYSSCCSGNCAKEECCTCTRELVAVLQGGATTLIALIVSLGKWYVTDFHFPKRKIIKCLPEVSLLRVFWTCIAGVLLPQIFMSFVLSSALCATILQQRVDKEKWRMARRLSSMVVWIQVDQPGIADMDAFFREHECLREFFIEYELPAASDVVLRDHALALQEQAGQEQISHEDLQKAAPLPELANVKEKPGVQDALVLYFSRSGEMQQLITDEQRNINSGSTRAEKKDPVKISEQQANINASSATAAAGAAGGSHVYIFRSQDWDPKNRLWKEAMLKVEGVLPSIEELEPIQSRTVMECVAVAIQALGYFVSIVSRWFAAGAGGSSSRVVLAPVEIMSAWISIMLVVQVVAIPQLTTFCSKGMFLHLPLHKFNELVEFYENGKERRNDVDITFKTICLFVLCLFFLFGLFLILIPALVYYFYRLPHGHVLSFASLILFTLLSGISIIAFVLTLIYPALQVLSTFSSFPALRQPAALDAPAAHNYMTLVSSAVLLLGLSAYTLAIADTVLNWHSFRARDCYFSSFVIPHVGS